MIQKMSMTSTIINVPKIMQETSTYCSAATIQQTLSFINGSCPTTQSALIGATGAGPGLQTVLNYVNSKINGKPYTVYNFNSSTSFFRLTLRAKENSRPVIYTLANDGKQTNSWPYLTGGHFVNCAGYFSFSTASFESAYFFCDPYYFNKYMNPLGITLDPLEEGEVVVGYATIKYVSSCLHGNQLKAATY